jgi:hypothetical protein
VISLGSGVVSVIRFDPDSCRFRRPRQTEYRMGIKFIKEVSVIVLDGSRGFLRSTQQLIEGSDRVLNDFTSHLKTTTKKNSR